MLIETNGSGNFGVGDTVLITGTTQTGRITAFKNGKWEIQVDGGPTVLKESASLEKRTNLFG